MHARPISSLGTQLISLTFLACQQKSTLTKTWQTTIIVEIITPVFSIQETISISLIDSPYQVSSSLKLSSNMIRAISSSWFTILIQKFIIIQMLLFQTFKLFFIKKLTKILIKKINKFKKGTDICRLHSLLTLLQTLQQSILTCLSGAMPSKNIKLAPILLIKHNIPTTNIFDPQVHYHLAFGFPESLDKY